jgi:pimeloyl-ACP methyl ester carboxylesterase
MAIARTGEQFTPVGSGEVELAYESFGDPADPAVLLIMGLGSQMIFWPDELCEVLAAAGHHVIRFDNRDAGRSTVLDHHEPPPVRQVVTGELDAPYLLGDMAADAVGLLDALGIDRAHIVGASLGGMIAQRVAIDHPDRVLSLASIMSTTGDSEVGRPTPEAMAVLMTRAPADHDGYIRTTLEARAVIGSQPPDRDRILDLAQRAYERGYHPDGTARQFAAVVASPDRTPELRDLSVPTVVIHGALDPLIGVSGGEATAAAIPGAELVVIENMGHDLPLWALDRIAAALQQNFERAEARAV